MTGLTMTTAATDGWIHIPVVYEFFAQLPLGSAGWRFPVQVRNLVEGTKIILRSAMAFQAPSHALGFCMIDNLHVVDLAVASDATDPAIHVNGVIEVNIIGSLVDSNPRNRIAAFP
jgi:hypothetical protein